MTKEEGNSIDLVGKYAATLSVIEVALGSLLHGLRIPMSGNFLSLNQGYLLCRLVIAAPGRSRRTPYAVSNVAAALKSLAPAGKKLGPMLSLSMQGLLFTVGLCAGGTGRFGLMLGMVLLSFWTFLQPLITYYIFFGRDLFAGLAYLLEKTLPYHGVHWQWLLLALLLLVAIKAALAAYLALLAFRSGGDAFQERLWKLAEARGLQPLAPKSNQSKAGPFLLALRDLTHPLFLFGLLTTGAFLYFSQEGEGLWLLLRPLSLGFLFFYFSRTLTLDRWIARLEHTRWNGFAVACRRALKELREFGSKQEAKA
jgi:hypothetical protein